MPVHLLEWFCVTTGIIYCEKKGNIFDESVYDYYLYKGTFIKIPLMADFRIIPPWFEKSELTLYAGPYISYINSPGLSSDYTVPDVHFSTWETGVILGTGYYYYFSKIAIVVKQTISIGLSNIINEYNFKTITSFTSIGIAF